MTLRKKGSLSDLPFIIVGIFTIAIVALLVTILVNNLDIQVQGNDVFTDKAKTASTNLANDFPQVMDGGVLLIFFALVIISLVLAALVPVHPAFLIFFFLEWLLLIYVGAVIANVYQEIIENPIFATEAGQYVITTFFFHYFPYIVGIVGAILAIVIYKTREKFLFGR